MESIWLSVATTKATLPWMGSCDHTMDGQLAATMPAARTINDYDQGCYAENNTAWVLIC